MPHHFILPSLCLLSLTAASAVGQCRLQEIMPVVLRAGTDEVIWEGRSVALIQGVSVDKVHQTSWSGPVVSVRPDGSPQCTAQVENLHPPFVLGAGRYFYYITGDGVDFQLQMLDLASCTIRWASQRYEWYEAKDLLSYQSNRFQIGNTRYKIHSDCMVRKQP